jgi:hypothetical protein
VTFTGFRRLPKAQSLVYVELTAPVEVRMTQRGTELVYTLEGAQVPLRNNRNPLITSAFEANVLSVRLVERGQPATKSKQRKKAEAAPPSVDLVVRLRTEVTPSHALVRGASGPVLEVTIPDARGP